MIDIRDSRTYIENFLKIKTKSGTVVPLKLNKPQRELMGIVEELRAEGKPVRIIILKARQEGFSTMTEALIFHGAATRRNVNALIVAHREDATSNLFRMSKLYLDELPVPLKPLTKASNAQEIVFENPSRIAREREIEPGLRSRIRCVTAGGKGIGRSDTLQYVHISEYAFWPEGAGGKEDTLIGIMQAVPSTPETMVVIESTANGFDDFKTRWDRAVAGEDDFTPVFFSWFDDPEYSRWAEPGFSPTEEERELQKRYGLSDEQLSWRRWCIANNCGGDLRKFQQEYPSNPEEAFLHSGQGVFDNGLVQRRLESCKPEIRRGSWERDADGQMRWRERELGDIKIFREPEERVPYVLGGDTAGEGSDWFTAIVINNVTGEIVATLRRQTSEPEYVQQVYELASYYNRALVGLEVNFSTYPTQKLVEMDYSPLYIREREDSITGGLQKSFGFRTTSQTRPRIIAALVETFGNHPDWFGSPELLREMLTFVYNDNHRPEAMQGEHDDMVMAAAITYDIRGQQSFGRFPEEQKKQELSPLAREARKQKRRK